MDLQRSTVKSVYSILPSCPTRQDLLTRWPALDVSARRDRLAEHASVVPGPSGSGARRIAAVGGNPCRDWTVAARSARPGRCDPEVHKVIANRLGWLDSPALMADALERLHDIRGRDQERRASPTPCCWAWAARASRPKCCGRCVGTVARLAAPPHARLDRSGGGPRRRHAGRHDALHPRQQVRHDDRAQLARGAISGRGCSTPASRPGRSHFIAITDAGTELATRARREKFRESSSTRPTSAGAIPRCRFSGWSRRRSWDRTSTRLVAWGLAMLAVERPRAPATSTRACGRARHGHGGRRR